MAIAQDERVERVEPYRDNEEGQPKFPDFIHSTCVTHRSGYVRKRSECVNRTLGDAGWSYESYDRVNASQMRVGSFFAPEVTPPSLIHLMDVNPPTPQIHLLSSKEKAHCPSWERKNTSRARFSEGVRLKAAEHTTQITQKRTTDSTSVERSAKVKTACIHTW